MTVQKYSSKSEEPFVAITEQRLEEIIVTAKSGLFWGTEQEKFYCKIIMELINDRSTTDTKI